MAVRAELLDDIDGLAPIVDGWRELGEAAGNAFLTPEWLLTWYRHYGDTATPWVLAVRDDDELIGVLPLARSGRTVRFAGDNVGDRFHPLARSGREDEVVRAAAAVLGRRGRSTLLFKNVDEHARWRSVLTSAWPARTSTTRLRGTVLPYTPIAGQTWESFLGARSRNFRSQVRRKERALLRDHGAVFRCTERPEQVPEDMGRFFGLHDARWDTRGGSRSATDRVRLFHTDFATVAARRGWLRLWFLEIDGTAVAAWYGWRIGDRYAYYLAGFDPVWAEASVGLVLLAHTVRSAIEEGAGEYDLLLGDEPYKGRFATAERAVETVVQTTPLDPARFVAYADASARRLVGKLSPELRRALRSGAGGVLARLPGETVR